MLSVAESASILNVSPARVRALISQGALPAAKVGRVWTLREEDVMQRASLRPTAGRPRKGRAPDVFRQRAARPCTEPRLPHPTCMNCSSPRRRRFESGPARRPSPKPKARRKPPSSSPSSTSSCNNDSTTSSSKARTDGRTLRPRCRPLVHRIRRRQRIRHRVETGGHGIDEATVRRRYRTSLANCARAIDQCEEIQVLDNTVAFKCIALWSRGSLAWWGAPKQVGAWLPKAMLDDSIWR